jgi:hypothetical protein
MNVEKLIRWQRKHKLRTWQIEELIRWLELGESFLFAYKDAIAEQFDRDVIHGRK